jgi:hypothetical protein
VGRVEYWNDPAAPKPNSLVPACGILAVDDHSGRYAALPCARRAPPPGSGSNGRGFTWIQIIIAEHPGGPAV